MERTTPSTGLAVGVPLELGEPRAAEKAKLGVDGSRADSTSFVGQGLKGHNQSQG